MSVNQTGRTILNTVMLFVMTFVKIALPFVTFPYLTRILSKDCYGVVGYVKQTMIYFQLIIDFGFLLSAVKDITKLSGNKEEIGKIAGSVFIGKSLLMVASFIVLIPLLFIIPILKENYGYTLLSFAGVALTFLLGDFVFRGIEKMYIITIIFVISKGITTSLTFLLVKGDNTIMFIPILEIVGNIFSISISILVIILMKIKIKFTSFSDVLLKLKNSFMYFLSNFSTTALGAFNTFMIGIFMKDEVSNWLVAMQLISAIQVLYAPIVDGIYPQMTKEKNLRFVHKVLFIFVPLITIGCVVSFFLAKWAILVVSGEKYVDMYWLFRLLIPVLFFSFPAMIYGWPTLGSIGKTTEVTLTTIFAAIFQIVGLIFLLVIGQFNLVSIAILRVVSELVLFIERVVLTYKFRNLFFLEDKLDENSRN